jgi:uncharacterized protein YaaQ
LPEKRKYATLSNPVIEAVTQELFRFTTLAQAEARLKEIHATFITSTEQPEDTKVPTALLWIKGYALTPEEQAEGRQGNYAMISAREKLRGTYTLSAMKVNAPLEKHPMKKRPQRRNPDWGIPPCAW